MSVTFTSVNMLPMILLPQIVRTALELHDRHLGALAMAHDRGQHLATLERGRAELDVRALADEQHFAKLDRRARLSVELLDLSTPSLVTRYCLPPVAMTAYMVFKEIWGEGERPRILLATQAAVKRRFFQGEQVLSAVRGTRSSRLPRGRKCALGTGCRRAALKEGETVCAASPRSARMRAQMSLEEIRAPVREDLRAVDAAIRARLKSAVPLVDQIAEHIIAGGGKRLRPLLVVLSARACAVRARLTSRPQRSSSSSTPRRSCTMTSSTGPPCGAGGTRRTRYSATRRACWSGTSSTRAPSR